MYKVVAQGGMAELQNLAAYEGAIDEGSRGKLELDLRLPVPDWTVAELEGQLVNARVAEAKVTQSGSRLGISFRKGFPWLAVIAAIVLGLVVIAILIIGWTLFKEVIPEPLKFPVALGLIIIAGIVAVGYARRRI